jgi:Acyl-CoA dehydrogenase, C-terminal domain
MISTASPWAPSRARPGSVRRHGPSSELPPHVAPRGARGELRLAAAHAAAESARSVDIAYRLAGTTSIFATQPFERRFRDIHAATQNFTLSPDRYGDWGRFLLDVAPPEW